MYRKKQPMSKLKLGDRVEDIFVVKIKRSFLPYVKGFRFVLVLSDMTGKSIDFTYWGGQEEAEVKGVFDSIKQDDVVLVKGKVGLDHKGKLTISANPPDDTIGALQKGEYDVNEFIMPPKRSIEEMASELKGCMDAMQNTEIMAILNKIFIQDQNFFEKFKIHPGAIEIHHNWKGGLLQHTLEVVKYCELTKKIFNNIDKDILIAGAILHDIGKVNEIEVTTRIKSGIKGQLKGHIAIGFSMLSRVMDELGTSEEIRNKLLHIVLSHHGYHDLGSPREPMFPEALAIYYADEMSSKMAQIIAFVEGAKDETEDDFMYSRRHERNILLR